MHLRIYILGILQMFKLELNINLSMLFHFHFHSNLLEAVLTN